MKIKLRICRHKSLQISPAEWSAAEIRKTFFQIVDDWCETRGIPLSAFNSRTRYCYIRVSLRDRSRVDSDYGIVRLKSLSQCDIGVGTAVYGCRFLQRIRYQASGMTFQEAYLKSKIDAVIGILAHEICHVLDHLWGFSLDHDVANLNQSDGWYHYFLNSNSEYRAEDFAARHSDYAKATMVEINRFAEEKGIEKPM